MRFSEGLVVEIEVPQQRNLHGGARFPAVVTPSSSPSPSPQQLIESHKQLLDSLLAESGALLLRGFQLNTPSDFNDVVEAFGYDEFRLASISAPRSKVVGRVFTANESPPEQYIAFHHEMALVPEFPSKLFFFCEVEPQAGSGGETPIVLSNLVYEKMKKAQPEFVERLEKHGLLYTRFLGDNDDTSSPIGRGWKSNFNTTDKTLAQQRANEMGMKLEWLEEGGVKMIIGPVEGVRYDERRGCKVWFHTMVGWDDPSKPVTFGDGEPLPEGAVTECLRIMEEECVAIPWNKGDVLIIDNLAVLHARRPCNTPRRVLASLAS
ncbi:hypothetical protein HN51_025867 [Arachis hypogaea]|uniref:TauD/TfdA-like domain-containing protein n=1 Tax=Arachis hypogaea TaxID=3818 RepID=A0A445CFH8_ARAHY|nr:Clavaminate synthase-like protein [Arachis hypogaea]RYR49675.1 hypothetical protein Ahy_A07g036207 [Arachis hypogaea]